MDNWNLGFLIYISIVIIIIIVTIIMIRKYLNKAKKYKNDFLTLEEANLDEEKFYKTFDIKCDYCGNIFNTSNSTCPKCGGEYHKNKKYLEEIKEMNTEYYNYLNAIQNEIEKKLDTYYKVIKDLRKNIFINHSFFDFEIKVPQREKIDNVSIFCEYCGTKTELKIGEEKQCPNCNSSFNENMELKAYIKKNEIIDIEHEKYLKLNELLINQNIKNKKFDSFMTHNYWYATLYGLFMLVFPIIPAYLITHSKSSKELFTNIFLNLTTLFNIAFPMFMIFIFFIIFIKKKK